MVECECSMGLGRLYSPQRRVMVYMSLAYIKTGSPGLMFERRRRRDQDSLSGQCRDGRTGVDIPYLHHLPQVSGGWRGHDRDAFLTFWAENLTSLLLQ